MNKPRIRSPLDRLPLPVKQQLMAWLTTAGPDGHGLTYIQASAKLLAEFGVKANPTALCLFFKRHNRINTVTQKAIDVALPTPTQPLTITVNLRLLP